MTALPLMLTALCVLALAYRYYSAFLCARVLALDDRPTPAVQHPDGQNFVPTRRLVLFGHHFAAITGAGPLIGPVLACQFGYAPGFVWLVAGVVLAGAVHDLVALVGSVRHGGRSLAELVREEVSPGAGAVASVAILCVLVLAVAAMAFAVVNSMKADAWGAFTLAASIPLAMVMGFWIHSGKGIGAATAFGLIGLFAAMAFGGHVEGLPPGDSLRVGFEAVFALTAPNVAWAVVVYGVLGSTLPVWVLLTPRDYLSTYLKLGIVAALILGVLVVQPPLLAPAVSQFVHGGGPIVPGKLFPFLFITIACGAISGFHSLIASGTTSKMLAHERDARLVGYGAMLCEGLVGVTCLIAAAALHPADYYAINATPEVFAKLGLQTVDLASLEQALGVTLAGKTGGAVSLAVGMAKVFAALPIVRAVPRALAYWYHFAIVFEGLFILTTVDAGTRVARYLVQEQVRRVSPRLGRADFWPLAVVSSVTVAGAWGWLVFSSLQNPRGMGLLWTMLGVSNQLLAVIALAFATTWLVNQGRARYAWATLVPLCFVGTTTFTAGAQSIARTYLPLLSDPARRTMGLVCLTGIGTVLVCAAAVVIAAGVRIARSPNGAQPALSGLRNPSSSC